MRIVTKVCCSAITVVLCVLTVLIAPKAHAAGVVGTGSAASCTDSALDLALMGGGLVTFNCGGGPVTITALTTKVITISTTIDGVGNFITLSGGNARRVLQVMTGTLTVQNLTIANGSSGAGDGGGIQNFSTLVVNNSTFTGNTSASVIGGGAISTQGATVEITNSTFTGNSATAGTGGAIHELGSSGLVTLRNVTISGNSAVGSAGGFFDNADNSEAFNTIIANNTPDNCGGDPFPNSSLYNLISDASCGSSISGGTGNLINTNPMLAALASNGGPTQTMALNPGSPAIDAGSPNAAGSDACASVDQRGVARPQGPRCDMGAFEGAVVIAAVSSIPTLSQWATMFLAAFVGLAAVMMLRRAV